MSAPIETNVKISRDIKARTYRITVTSYDHSGYRHLHKSETEVSESVLVGMVPLGDYIDQAVRDHHLRPAQEAIDAWFEGR